MFDCASFSHRRAISRALNFPVLPTIKYTGAGCIESGRVLGRHTSGNSGGQGVPLATPRRRADGRVLTPSPSAGTVTAHGHSINRTLRAEFDVGLFQATRARRFSETTCAVLAERFCSGVDGLDGIRQWRVSGQAFNMSAD